MKALKSTANTDRHSRITGTAPAGARLILKKTFMTPTSPVIDGNGVEGDMILFKDKLKTKLDVGKSRPLRLARQPVHAPARRPTPALG